MLGVTLWERGTHQESELFYLLSVMNTYINANTTRKEKLGFLRSVRASKPIILSFETAAKITKVVIHRNNVVITLEGTLYTLCKYMTKDDEERAIHSHHFDIRIMEEQKTNSTVYKFLEIYHKRSEEQRGKAFL